MTKETGALVVDGVATVKLPGRPMKPICILVLQGRGCMVHHVNAGAVDTPVA